MRPVTQSVYSLVIERLLRVFVLVNPLFTRYEVFHECWVFLLKHFDLCPFFRSFQLACLELDNLAFKLSLACSFVSPLNARCQELLFVLEFLTLFFV